jgi:predicted metalloprotease with PDZ domain
LSEGATTWYGDVMLYRGKVFDDAAFFRTFNQILDRHYNNPGSSNMSVASSSYDTWLDGYVMGVPNRKASIYTEGALITFMLDVEIRKLTKNEQSFDDVMCSFYNDYYKNGKGVSEADYKSVVEHFASKNLDVFFSDFINGSKDFSENLEQCMEYFGLEFQMTPSATFHEAYLGVRIFDNKVITVFPNSHADLAGISVGDEIVILNGFKINDDLSQWLDYFKDAPISMGAFDQHGSAKRIMVTLTEDVYYSKNEVCFVDELTEGQKENLKAWRKY